MILPTSIYKERSPITSEVSLYMVTQYSHTTLLFRQYRNITSRQIYIVLPYLSNLANLLALPAKLIVLSYHDKVFSNVIMKHAIRHCTVVTKPLNNVWFSRPFLGCTTAICRRRKQQILFSRNSPVFVIFSRLLSWEKGPVFR